MEINSQRLPPRLRKEIYLLVMEHLKALSPIAAVDYEKHLRAAGMINSSDSLESFTDEASETLYELIRGLLSYYMKSNPQRSLQTLFELVPRLRGRSQVGGGFIYNDLVESERDRRRKHDVLAPSRFRAIRELRPRYRDLTRSNPNPPGTGDPVAPYFEKQYKVLGHHFSSADGFQSDCNAFCCAYDLTGKYVCSGADNGRIKLWSTNSSGEGMWLVNYFTLPSYVIDMGFSADNNYLVAVDNHRLSIFDWKSPKLDPLIARFELTPSDHTRNTSGLRLSPISQPNGVQAALVGSSEGYLQLFRWKLLDAKDQSLPEYDKISRLDDQTCMLAGEMSWTGAGERRLWRELWTIRQYWYKRDKIDSFAFHPSGLMFAHGGSDGYIYVYGMASVSKLVDNDATIYTYKRPSQSTVDMKAMESNRIMLQHQRHFGLANWSLKPVLLCRVDAHRGTITNLQWSPDGEKLLSESNDGSIKVWADTSNQQFLSRGADVPYTGLQLLFKVSLRPELVERALVYMPTAAKARDSAVAEMDDCAHQTASEQERSSILSSSCWSTNGQQIISASSEYFVCVFDGECGRLQHVLEGEYRDSKHESRIAFVKPHPFHPHLVLTAGWDGLISVWNTVRGFQVQAWTATGHMFDGSWSPFGNQFAVATSQGRLVYFGKSALEPENPYLPDTQRQHNLSDQGCQVQMRFARAFRDLEPFLERAKPVFDMQKKRWSEQFGLCPESQYFYGELLPTGAALGQNLRTNSSSMSRRSQQIRSSQQPQSQQQNRQQPLLGTAHTNRRIDPWTLCDVKGVVYPDCVQNAFCRAAPQVLFGKRKPTGDAICIDSNSLQNFPSRALEYCLENADYYKAIHLIGQMTSFYGALQDDDKAERSRRRKFLPEPKEDTFDEVDEMAQIMQDQEERTLLELMAPNAPLASADNEASDPDFEESSEGERSRRRRGRNRRVSRRLRTSAFVDLEATEDNTFDEGDYSEGSGDMSDESSSESSDASSEADSEDSPLSRISRRARAPSLEAEATSPSNHSARPVASSPEATSSSRRPIRRAKPTSSLDDLFGDEDKGPSSRKERLLIPHPRLVPEWWVSSNDNVSFPFVPQRGDIIAISVAGLLYFQEHFALSDAESELHFLNQQSLQSYYRSTKGAVDDPLDYKSKEFVFGIVQKLEYSVAKVEGEVPRHVLEAYDEWRAEQKGSPPCYARVRMECVFLQARHSDEGESILNCLDTVPPESDASGNSSGAHKVRTILGDFSTVRKLRFAFSFHETAPLYQFIVPLQVYFLMSEGFDLQPGSEIFDSVLGEESQALTKVSAKSSFMQWETTKAVDVSDAAMSLRAKPSRSRSSGMLNLTSRSLWQCICPVKLYTMLTSVQFRQLHRAVQKFASAEEYQIFHDPVNLSEFPDYLQLIAYPMSFSVILERLSNEYYRQFDALLWDLDLLVKNIKRYNTPESLIYHVAETDLVLLRDQIADIGAKFPGHFADADELSQVVVFSTERPSSVLKRAPPVSSHADADGYVSSASVEDDGGRSSKRKAAVRGRRKNKRARLASDASSDGDYENHVDGFIVNDGTAEKDNASFTEDFSEDECHSDSGSDNSNEGSSESFDRDSRRKARRKSLKRLSKLKTLRKSRRLH